MTSFTDHGFTRQNQNGAKNATNRRPHTFCFPTPQQPRRIKKLCSGHATAGKRAEIIIYTTTMTII